MENWIKELSVGGMKDVFVESFDPTGTAWYDTEKGGRDCCIDIIELTDCYCIVVSKNNSTTSHVLADVSQAQHILDVLIEMCERLDNLN